MHSPLRHGTVSVLSALYEMTGQLPSLLGRPRVQFLYLHHVLEEDEAAFRELLRTLSRNHCFISYSEAVDRIWTGEIDKSYVALSFDDGLKGCLRAAEIAGEFGVKACFFLCASMVGAPDDHKTWEFCVRVLRIPPASFLSWGDAERLLAQGHEIGSHTMTHPDLSRLTGGRLETEVLGSRELLTRRLGGVQHFSWPFGRFGHFSPEARRIVFAAGFRSCASAERGCHVAQTTGPDLCIRRDHTVAGWPIRHTLYFLAKNSRTASLRQNHWPRGGTWSGVTER